MIYADTSAVLPYYRQEAHSASVERMFVDTSHVILLSDLTRVEFFSAVARWVHGQEITEPQAGQIEGAFADDLRAGRFRVAPLEKAVFDRAMRLLQVRSVGLKSLDAIHLSVAMTHQATLMTLDRQLRAAARFHDVECTALARDDD